MTDKKNLKICNSNFWAWESFLKGLMPRKGKNHKRCNYDYWTMNLYGASGKKQGIKN